MYSTALVRTGTTRDDLSRRIQWHVDARTNGMRETDADTEAITYIKGNTTYQVLNTVEGLYKDEDGKPDGLPTKSQLSLHFTGRVEGPSLTVAGFYGDRGSETFALTVDGTGRGVTQGA